MEKQIITFSANEQCLQKTGGIDCYASNTVAYIEAHFDLGTNWSGYDSVRAVWFTDFVSGISTVLDSDGVCIVPHEVLTRKSAVKVNLVGSIADGDVLTDRLTTCPVVALTIKCNAQVVGTETAAVTPSQFEQFVSIVQDAIANIKDIVSTTLNADYTLTFVYSDGTSYTTPSIRGERGPQGADGADGTDGNGIASAVLNSNYTLTLTFTDGTSYTTPSIRGERGPQGADGAEVTDARLGANGFTYASLGDAIREPIKAINEELEDITETYSVNLFDPDKATRGYLHAHGAGRLDVSANFAVSDFIPVKAGHTYYQNNAINTYYGGFYDTDKNYIDSLANSKTLSIESDGFIRVTCKLAEINTCQVEEGTDESRYSNYEDTALDKMLRAYTEAGRVSFSDWRRGTITNGIVTNNSHRIANTNINDLSYPVVVSADEGYRYVIVYYNEDSTWELDTDWINGYSFIPAHQRFRLLVACDPDAAETVNITGMATHIRVDRYRGELVGGTFNNINHNVLTIGDPLMSINHRGYNTEAPENTLSAFVESKRKGFNAIETDVCWTSDGIPVLLHDKTIDRTSNGTGAIASMTYAQARTYDFGSWFSPEFAEEKIPSVEELLLLAKRIDLDIVLEVEPVSNLTNRYIKALVDMVNTYGMNDKVIFASFDVKVLWKIGHYSPYARLMINVNAEYWAGLYTHYAFLKTPFNVVGFSYESDKITKALIDTCTYWHIPYMAWTLNSDQEILDLNGTCLVGVLSDNIIAKNVFKERYNIQ